MAVASGRFALGPRACQHRLVGPGDASIALALMAAALPAAAEVPDPICADRPGVATPTCTVPAGVVQIETTLIDWSRDRSSGLRIDELALGESAIKLGLSDRLHVEAVVAPFISARVRGGGERETVSGFGDITIAAKYRLTSGSSPVQLAVRPFVKLPAAKKSLGNGKAEGGIAVPIEFSPSGTGLSVALAPQLDLVADGEGSGHHLATSQVISLGIPLGERLSGSAEYWASWDFDPDGTIRQHGIAGSVAYLVTNDLQIDAGLVAGLNRAASDVQLYSGVAFRF